MNAPSNPSTQSNASQASDTSQSSDDGESNSLPHEPEPDPSTESDHTEGPHHDHPADEVQLAWHCDVDESIDRWLRAKYLDITKILGVPANAVTLAIVEDAEMAELHEQYKNVPGTTDVLTFDLRDPGADTEADAPTANVEPLDVEGDVALCLDEAKRQASARGHEVSHELLLYAVHGLLHLLGYDDHDEADAAAMHAREDELLSQVGLGPIFQSGN